MPPRGDRDFPPGFYQALGRVAIEFAEMEEMLAHFVSLLIGTDYKLGSIVTAELSFTQLSALASSLFIYRCEDPAADGPAVVAGARGDRSGQPERHGAFLLAAAR